MTGFVVGAASAASAASAPVAAAAATTAAEVGFFAAVGGFIAGWAFVILGVLVLLGILSEHNESSGWAVFWMLLIAGVVALTFHIPLVMLGIGAVAYLAIGLFWSFWRYKRHVTKKVEEYKEKDAREREYALRALHPKAMLGTITAWIVVWPFSLVESLVGDIIDFIKALVTKFFRGVYFRIYDAAVAALKP
jgi:MFS family permease